MCFYFQYFKATPGVADLMGARVGYLKRGSDVYNEVVNQRRVGRESEIRQLNWGIDLEMESWKLINTGFWH